MLSADDGELPLAKGSGEVGLELDMNGILFRTFCINLLTLEGDFPMDPLSTRITVCLISLTLSTIRSALGRIVGSPAQPSETSLETSPPTFRSTCDNEAGYEHFRERDRCKDGRGGQGGGVRLCEAALLSDFGSKGGGSHGVASVHTANRSGRRPRVTPLIIVSTGRSPRGRLPMTMYQTRHAAE